MINLELAFEILMDMKNSIDKHKCLFMSYFFRMILKTAFSSFVKFFSPDVSIALINSKTDFDNVRSFVFATDSLNKKNQLNFIKCFKQWQRHLIKWVVFPYLYLNKHVYRICNHDKSFYFTFDKDSLNDFVKYNACKQKIE